MCTQVRYLTNEQGERIGVLLDLDVYSRLANEKTIDDEECLTGLSQAELQALAESILAPATQTNLDELLALNAKTQLSAEQLTELDHLLAQIDQLTILKTRARYTLKRLSAFSSV